MFEIWPERMEALVPSALVEENVNSAGYSRFVPSSKISTHKQEQMTVPLQR